MKKLIRSIEDGWKESLLKILPNSAKYSHLLVGMIHFYCSVYDWLQSIAMSEVVGSLIFDLFNENKFW